MLSTHTYDDFRKHVMGFVGSSLNDDEWARINSNANFAARRAYRASQWWERFLVTSEPRTVIRGEIQSTEDSFNVYGAGTDAANGLYQRNGTANSKAKYTLYGDDGTTALYDIEWDGVTDWQILDQSNNVIYDITDASSTPPLSGWAANTGTVPAPLLVDVANIDTFLAVDQYDIFQDRTSHPIIGHAVAGRYILHQKQPSNILYVTYKKAHTDIYGDGSSGTVSDIPSEWFFYMALHASYMYLAAERGANPNGYAGVAYREVEEALQDELMRIEEQGLSNVSQRVQTHLQYNTSLL